MHLLLNALFLIAAIIWGDWRNWRKYHSTILLNHLPYYLFLIDSK